MKVKIKNADDRLHNISITDELGNNIPNLMITDLKIIFSMTSPTYVRLTMIDGTGIDVLMNEDFTFNGSFNMK
jgi:hypothetical protein